MKKKSPDKLVRLNSRLTIAQDMFVKKVAKKMKCTEGESLRSILDTGIRNFKLIQTK